MTMTTIALTIALILSIIAYYYQKAQVIQENSEIKKSNQTLEIQNIDLTQRRKKLSDEIVQKKTELTNIQSAVEAQENILNSLKSSLEIMRESAEQRAQSAYDARLMALESEFAQVKEEKEKQAEDDSRLLMKKLKDTEVEIEEAESKLADLEAKQLAYIQAQQRELEMETKRDYYRLVIDDEDIREVKSLRELQGTFNRKDTIDKLIWETYYKPAYDTLMPHIFGDKTKVCGIYKITNTTTGQPYIGQSVDARERMRQHIKASLSHTTPTNKLYQSMKKYGPENFTFELLEEIPRTKLDEREKYWIEFYKAKEFGMNGQKGNG